ncbi:hypothetical protein [Bradyrhizobium sp. ISRA437]|uniref:hypothetical protein n=1 Tax=Bradyrhizobium sp. ISRA437 TaxID=2866196 RepID=UPI0024789925|nr:hypothetical protein [Bradyrhizobium sp. ISRA437]WGS04941.1 hypothetical protein MTX18_27700 [Bradyrhizobium sp. ISRA437]
MAQGCMQRCASRRSDVAAEKRAGIKHAPRQRMDISKQGRRIEPLRRLIQSNPEQVEFDRKFGRIVAASLLVDLNPWRPVYPSGQGAYDRHAGRDVALNALQADPYVIQTRHATNNEGEREIRLALERAAARIVGATCDGSNGKQHVIRRDHAGVACLHGAIFDIDRCNRNEPSVVAPACPHGERSGRRVAARAYVERDQASHRAADMQNAPIVQRPDVAPCWRDGVHRGRGDREGGGVAR